MYKFKTNQQRAVAYAAYKELKRCLDADGELPPGFSMDVSGNQLTLVIPPGTTITRDRGAKGDGIIKKKATQNTYGFAVLALFLNRLASFNQSGVITRLLIQAVRDAVSLPNATTAETLLQARPDLTPVIEVLKKELPIPDREENTARIVNRERPGLMPYLDIRTQSKAAA